MICIIQLCRAAMLLLLPASSTSDTQRHNHLASFFTKKCLLRLRPFLYASVSVSMCVCAYIKIHFSLSALIRLPFTNSLPWRALLGKTALNPRQKWIWLFEISFGHALGCLILTTERWPSFRTRFVPIPSSSLCISSSSEHKFMSASKQGLGRTWFDENEV